MTSARMTGMSGGSAQCPATVAPFLRLARNAPLLALCVFLLGCGDNSLPVIEAEALERGSVQIVTPRDTLELDVEIAQTQSARAYGLMDRDWLGPNEGMLFVFDSDRPGDTPFWMFRTRIPLDIAFMDSTGTIVATMSMDPCESPVPRFCQEYTPGKPYRLVLEVNAGYYAARDIQVGDRMVWRSGTGGP